MTKWTSLRTRDHLILPFIRIVLILIASAAIPKHFYYLRVNQGLIFSCRGARSATTAAEATPVPMVDILVFVFDTIVDRVHDESVCETFDTL